MTERERPAWAARLQTEREARGWSKPEMARQLHRAAGNDHAPTESLVRQILEWERGKHFPRDWREDYATAFGLDEADLFPVARPVAYQPSQLAEQLRHDLTDALTAGMLNDAVLEDWERTVLRYGQATKDRPAGLLLADITNDLGELQRALVRCSSASTLRRLTRVVAHMSGLMCLTLIKLDDRQAFRGWARTARTAAVEAGDPVTHSWVLAQEAYGHYYAGDMSEAVNVAQQAQGVSRTPCVGSTLAAALEARAHAARGDHAETTAALIRAETDLGTLGPDAVMESAFAYDEAQLRFHEGNAFTHLGDTTSAWIAQERALALYPAGNFMDRALTRLDRASCIAQDGDPGSAMAYALDALTGLSDQQRQGIITTRGHEIVNALPRQHRTLSAARDVRDLLMLTTVEEEPR